LILACISSSTTSMSHVILPLTRARLGFINKVKKIAECICVQCGKLKISPHEDPRLNCTRTDMVYCPAQFDVTEMTGALCHALAASCALEVLGFINKVKKIAECICVQCGKLKISPHEDPRLNDAVPAPAMTFRDLFAGVDLGLHFFVDDVHVARHLALRPVRQAQDLAARRPAAERRRPVRPRPEKAPRDRAPVRSARGNRAHAPTWYTARLSSM
jgi:hypothetical protein